MVISGFNEDGYDVAKHKVHEHKSDYERATGRRFRNLNHSDDRRSFKTSDVPVAEGTSIEFHGTDEHESIRHDGRHTFVSGRCLLDPVTPPYAMSSVYNEELVSGSRLGLYPLSPAFIGGRLGHLAQDFTSHKMKRVRLIYVPSVGTSTNGSLLMYVTNSTTSTVLPVGRSELAHATSNEYAVSFPIWQTEYLDFKPTNKLNAYGDSPGEEAVSTVQAIATIETSSVISGTLGIMGSLYLDYECELYNPVLSYNVANRSNSKMQFEMTALQSSLNANENCVFYSNDNGTPYNSNSGGGGVLIQIPAGLSTVGDLENMVFCGVLNPFTDSTNAYRDVPVTDPATIGTKQWESGAGFYARVVATNTNIHAMYLFSTLEAASAAEIDPNTNEAAKPLSWVSAFTINNANWMSVCYGSWSRLE